MTYRVPELLLLGAATNLVLAASEIQKSSGVPDDLCQKTSSIDELGTDFYEFPGNW